MMLKKMMVIVGAIAIAASTTGCFTRIETGEVGLRIGFDKQIKSGEILPGSFPQTVIGDVITFPVKDVNVQLENMTPIAKDNSTMADMDAVVVYNINQDQVSELYTTKSKAFHATFQGDTYLMYNYVVQMARNAIYKVSREYEALDMNDNRQAMEQKIRETMARSLAEEKLDGAITVSQVLIRNIAPAASVVASANELVRAKNELKQKEVEVKTAEAEARRMAALANQSAQSIEYMKAQTGLIVAEAIKAGKVNTIIIPHNLTMLGNTK